MIVLIICLSLLSLIVGWLLIAPLRLTIDTNANSYCIDWQNLAHVRVLPKPDDVSIYFKVLFWKKELSLFHLITSKRSHGRKKKKRTQSHEKRKSKKIKAKVFFRKAKKILKTFKVRTFKLQLDTDDYILNSYLFPIFHLLNRPGQSISINFEGRSSLRLIVENKPYKILKAIIF